jgi:hypothetical protein
MALRLIGKDPDSPDGQSPTVWVDDVDGSIVIQGWKLDENTAAEVGDVPSHETLLRLPRRMAPFLREVVGVDPAGTA